MLKIYLGIHGSDSLAEQGHPPVKIPETGYPWLRAAVVIAGACNLLADVIYLVSLSLISARGPKDMTQASGA